ncbi:sensor histidine kinase [Herpetosiphon llansteffanensis]|uniref:sensor histidine kinase n=1 Tax=Herpetosiphon llansteffanensis TaxID=2094568 RepID=UPI000F51A90C|nr:HAMP domain-containing sensor histidine kinase [Herpetosiphon llansteffanensis]
MHERWHRWLYSRWWYAAALLYLAAALIWPELGKRSGATSRLVEVLILLVCVGRFWLPAIQRPHSALAKGWRILALQWGMLALYRSLGGSLTSIKGLSQVVLPIIVYVPTVVMAGAFFVSLPFSQRRRSSIALDWFGLSVGLMIITTIAIRQVVPNVAWYDGLFVGADLSLLYALDLIRQQQPKRWQALFHQLSSGILALSLVDLGWIFDRSKLVVLPIGALYCVAWLILAQAAAIHPNDTSPLSNQLSIDTLAKRSIPYVIFLGGLGFTIATGELNFALLLLPLLLLRISVEMSEAQQLSLRLEQARREATHARDEAEFLRELLRSSIHDLRSPIDGATGLINVLERQPQRMQLWNLLRVQIEDIGQQMHDLLDIARAQTKAMLQQTPVNLAEICSAEIARLEASAAFAQKANKPQIQATLQPIQAHTNQRLLGRALYNLLKNSLDHGGDQLSLSIELQAASINILIHDNGSGFPQHVLNLEPSSSTGEGYGFGLRGVLANLSLIGASLQLENRQGAWACIQLPRSERSRRI